MKRWTRHTVMDGRVVSFAMDFEQRSGPPLATFEATGPFLVSVSRNRMVVHRADLHNEESYLRFMEALYWARKEFNYLKRHDGRPQDDEPYEPREVEEGLRVKESN